MFHFRKKDKEEKDKKKVKEKKEKKEHKTVKEKPLTHEELNRLEMAKSTFFSVGKTDEKRESVSPGAESVESGGSFQDRPISLTIQSDFSESSLSSYSGRSPENYIAKSNNATGMKQTAKLTSPTKPSARLPVPTSKQTPPKPNVSHKGILKGRSSSTSKKQSSNSGVNGKTSDIGSNKLSKASKTLPNQGTAPVSSLPHERGVDEVDKAVVADSSVFPGEALGINQVSYQKLNFPLPALQPMKLPKSRVLTIPRLPAGDFGFSLRRATIIDKQTVEQGEQMKKTIIFAEPGSLDRTNVTGLFPGDRLLEVNNVSVENKSRDEIITLIKSSGSSVTLRVQMIPELVELTHRTSAVDGYQVELDEDQIRTGTLLRSGSKRFKKSVKSEDQLTKEKEWFDKEKVWLLHKDGFSSANRIKVDSNDSVGSEKEGKVMVELDYNDKVIEVEEEDVERANPPHYDKIEELSQLMQLNESSVLHVLRQRYASNLIHTYAGNTMLVINPVHPLPIYSEKIMQLFKGCRQEDMPPHVYAVAQSAYRKMLVSRRDQAIVLSGRSGSGKTTNFRQIIQCLVQGSGSLNKVLTGEKMNAVATILEAFGNSRTAVNTNASRFTQLFSIDYDQSGLITSASIQVFLLEKNRVARRPVKEPTFHVLYQMIAGIGDSLRKELLLDNLSDFNIFMSPLQRIEDKQKATLAWACIRNAMNVVGITDEEVKAITSVLSAIYHLGSAGAVPGSGSNGAQFSKPQNAQKAADLLGTSIEELSRTIFSNASSSSSLPSRTYRTSSPVVDKSSGDITADDAVEALEAMVSGLYTELFHAVVSLVNRSLSTGNRSVSSVLVLDSPGMQNPATCGRTTGASFQELCYNYAQDRLQLLFHESTFITQQDKYAQENVDCDLNDLASFVSNPAAVVNLMDKQSQQSLTLSRSSTSDLRDAGSAADHKGLLWILEEECLYPGSTDRSFVDRIKSMAQHDKGKSDLIRVDGQYLTIKHLQGTNAVKYNTSGWLRYCRENAISKSVLSFLQDSDRESISKLFVCSRGIGNSASNISISSLDAGSSASLRRMSSIRRGGGVAFKRRSVPLHVKFQMDALVETLRRTSLHFVLCFIPNHDSALSDVKSSLNASPLLSTRMNETSADPAIVNVPLVRSQLRGFQILDSLRMHKQGFPSLMLFSEFRRKFSLLLPPKERQTIASSPVLDERRAVEMMIEHLDVEKSSYRLGISKIFFRSGALSQIKDQRDEKLKDVITGFQAHCRAKLGRNNLKKLRVQDMAMRCIQRNIRKFNAIKEWPWWRLYVKLLPVLNVHKTEQDLKNKDEELAVLRSKVDKYEKDNVQLKHERDKLEAKMSELSADLAEEHATTVQAAEVLDVHASERMRLEKDVQELQHKLSQAHKYTANLEMEVMESRMLKASEMNGDLSDDDSEINSVYKQKYERSIREFEFTKKRLKQQHEEELEQEMLHRKAVDKKLSDALVDFEEERHNTIQWKKKYQKLLAEMQDLRMMLENQTARNLSLEKKQKKFDSELNYIQDELKKEKTMKEKVSREKEQLSAEKFSVEQELQSVKLDMDLQSEKLNQLNRELDELTYGNKGDEEIFQLKKSKHELERKIQDQEEELDDLAGQVQILEQAKLRLEMNFEKIKQEHRKEINAKEDEGEEIRAVASKKVKMLEMQLEGEHDERQQLIRDKHELERHIIDLQDRPPQTNPEMEKRLRKDLKRTKALLRDSQMMLNRIQENNSSKSAIRQLKNQLEDAEFARMATLKSKQGVEMELEEIKCQLEEVSKSKAEIERKYSAICREKAEIQCQLEDSEEEVAEVMKKYKATVAQLSIEQMTLNEQSCMISDLEAERQSLKSLLADLSTKLEMLEGETTDIHTVKRLEMKVKELESKLELEATSKNRLEVQMNRLKEQCEKLQQESSLLCNREQQATDSSERLSRQIRELKEDLTEAQQKEADAHHKIHQLEISIEASENDHQATKADLKLAFRRIEDLQAAMEGEIESDDLSDMSHGNSDTDDDSDGENLDTFLSRHKTSFSTPSRNRYSMESSSSSEAFSSSIRHSSSAEFHSLSPGGSRIGLYDEVESIVPSVADRGPQKHAEEFV